MVTTGQDVNVSSMGLGVPVTFDPLRSEILWLASGDCMQYTEEGNVSVCLRYQSVIHRQAVSDATYPGFLPAPNISIQGEKSFLASTLHFLEFTDNNAPLTTCRIV